MNRVNDLLAEGPIWELPAKPEADPLTMTTGCVERSCLMFG